MRADGIYAYYLRGAAPLVLLLSAQAGRTNCPACVVKQIARRLASVRRLLFARTPVGPHVTLPNPTVRVRYYELHVPAPELLKLPKLPDGR